MDKLAFADNTFFKDLPLDSFDGKKFYIYVLDKDWNYLFVNDFVKQHNKGEELKGKNMWKQFPELYADPVYSQMKKESEAGKRTNYITISPVTSLRLNIVGQPLRDCYFFTCSILPKKEDLINELRHSLSKG